MDQPGKVANPARGQLNRENNIPLSLVLAHRKYFPKQLGKLTGSADIRIGKSLIIISALFFFPRAAGEIYCTPPVLPQV